MLNPHVFFNILFLFFFYHGVVPSYFPPPHLLLSLSATMATAKDYPGPTTGKYPPRQP